jgi:hypothetical protein
VPRDDDAVIGGEVPPGVDIVHRHQTFEGLEIGEVGDVGESYHCYSDWMLF